MHAVKTETNPSKGILICLVAYFFIALIGICEKPIANTIPITISLFFQNAICLLLVIPTLLKNKTPIFKIKHPNLYSLRIITGLGCYAVLFYIIKFIPISEALLYQYSASLWIPFIALFWLNVQMPKKLWYGILTGFLGIILILKPGASFFGIISLLGIFCGVLQAISIVAIRKLSVIEPIARMLFYYFLTGTLITLPLVVKNWIPLGLKDYLFLFAIGISTHLGQVLATLSLQYAHATTLAPICYTSILFSGLLGWFFWHEIPDASILLGMALVIAGAILTIVLGSQKQPQTSFPTSEYENANN